MAEGSISQEFTTKKIVETRNCFTEEIDQNNWQVRSTKNFKFYWKLIYFSCCSYWLCFNFYFDRSFDF